MKNKLNLITFFSTSFFACLLDQISKKLLVEILREKGNIDILKFFSLTLVKNYGIVFGFLNNEKVNLFLIPFSIFVVLLIPLYILKEKIFDNFSIFSIGMIEGGIIGNLIDRITKGYVVDFINFHFWPVFNLADSFITIGIILFSLKFLRK